MFDLPENAISKGLSDPQGAFKYIYNQLIYKDGYLIARWINQLINQRLRNPGDLDVMKEDWDTLILIDACRFDYFSECADLPGTLSSKQSPASMSLGFIKENYVGRELHDTVYVTANPFASEIDSGTFHDVVSLIDDYYDNDAGTVPPEDLADAARKAHDNYPNKRIIVHFMQPHGPYFGEKAKEIRKKLMSEENISFTRLEDGPSNPDKTYPDLMHAASYGYLSSEDVQTVYEENLKMVLNYALQLQKLLEGKTVISADHGENLGNPSTYFSADYGHGGYSPEVREVPWVELEYETRKNVRRARPVKSNEVDEEVVIEQLESLGYME